MNFQIWFQYFFKRGLLGFGFLLLEIFLLEIGETNSVPLFLNSIESQEEIIVGQQIKNQLKDLKEQAIDVIDPQIMTIGNSRMNNFRANMFAPYSFYNLSRISTNFSEIQHILQKHDNLKNLKILFVIIEPFKLRKKLGLSNKPFSDRNLEMSPYNRFLKLIKVLEENIFLIEINYPKNLGINGVKVNRGIRSLDGSIHSGKHHQTTKTDQEKKFELYNERRNNLDEKDMFKYFDCELNQDAIDSYTSLVKYAESRGITIVGITPPFSDQVTEMLNSDEVKYKLWKTFNSEETIQMLQSISGYYFNFTDHRSFNSFPIEMIDLIHPSEKVCAKMLLKILEDKNLKKELNLIDVEYIKKKIESTPLPILDIFSDSLIIKN